MSEAKFSWLCALLVGMIGAFVGIGLYECQRSQQQNSNSELANAPQPPAAPKHAPPTHMKHMPTCAEREIPGFCIMIGEGAVQKVPCPRCHIAAMRTISVKRRQVLCSRCGWKGSHENANVGGWCRQNMTVIPLLPLPGSAPCCPKLKAAMPSCEEP